MLTLTGLALRNVRWFWRTNLSIILGVAVATAVITGALVVGDSVRGTLRALVGERLGKTESVLGSSGFFREELAAELGVANAPMLALEATVSREPGGERSGGVFLYGIDDRFYQFHGANAKAPAGREILLSPALRRELNASPGDNILVRLEQPSLIPREFLQGRRENPGRLLRFTLRERTSPEALGSFALRPQQGDVRAVFLPLSRLQRDLGLAGKVNTLLIAAGAAAARALQEKIQLADMGLSLKPLADGRGSALEHASTLLEDRFAAASAKTAGQLGIGSTRLLTYVANDMRAGASATPYSLITAVDSAYLEKLNGGKPLPTAQAAPMLITDWLARDLNVKTGGKIEVEYFVWTSENTLRTRKAEFVVAGVIPLQGLAVDRDVSPEYPGITDSETMSDWDPPFPVDLKKVRQKDEDYWKQYRTTPKAWIPLEVGQKLWGTRYGNLTSIRFDPAPPQLAQTLRANLDPLSGPLTLLATRQQGMDAAQGATDFGEYFLYFSFFIMVSALLLTALFFRLAIEQRYGEIGLLRATGFRDADIRKLFLTEGMILALAGVIAGLALAALYGWLLLTGLKTWWVDAVGTRLLRLTLSPLTLATGAGAGLMAALISILLTLRGLRNLSAKGLLSGTAAMKPARWARWLAPIAVVGALALLVAAASGAIAAAGGYFGAGSLLLVAALALASIQLRRGVVFVAEPGQAALARLGYRNAGWRPGRSLLCILLIASATFLLVSLESFRRGGHEMQGYPLMAESQAPLIFNPNTAEGRESLNLQQAPAGKWELFRLRPGDDVSCLNLYQPRNPRILAAQRSFLDQNRFTFAGKLGETANPWMLLEAPVGADGAVPAIVDQNSMLYVLHKKLGDMVEIPREGAEPLKLKLVASLADSVFQSELIIAESHFLRLFPEIQGYRVFLIDAPASSAGQFEEALSDYGFDATPTAERLAAYHRVENTYLSTFQALGGFGVLLGTVGLAAVLLRNALERRRELALLRALGYTQGNLEWLLLAENLFLLVGGLAAGFLCALLASAPALASRGTAVPPLGLVLMLLIVALAGWGASYISARAALRGPLLAALRAE